MCAHGTRISPDSKGIQSAAKVQVRERERERERESVVGLGGGGGRENCSKYEGNKSRMCVWGGGWEESTNNGERAKLVGG